VKSVSERQAERRRYRKDLHEARFAAFFNWPKPPPAWAGRLIWQEVSMRHLDAVNRTHRKVVASVRRTVIAIAMGWRP